MTATDIRIGSECKTEVPEQRNFAQTSPGDCQADKRCHLSINLPRTLAKALTVAAIFLEVNCDGMKGKKA